MKTITRFSSGVRTYRSFSVSNQENEKNFNS